MSPDHPCSGPAGDTIPPRPATCHSLPNITSVPRTPTVRISKGKLTHAVLFRTNDVAILKKTDQVTEGTIEEVEEATSTQEDTSK